jgi:hypothetical protein
MATRITTCDKCGSKNVSDINPELKETVKQNIVTIKAKCNDCNNEFEYPSSTQFGRNRGILY